MTANTKRKRLRFLILSGVVPGLLPRLFLGEHHHLIEETGNPVLGEAEAFVELSDREHGLYHIGLRIVIFRKDVVHGLFGHRADGALENARHTEFELHQVAREHHQVVGKGLELNKISLHILHLTTVLADALVDFRKEHIVSLIDILEHLLALNLLAHAQFDVVLNTRRSGSAARFVIPTFSAMAAWK